MEERIQRLCDVLRETCFEVHSYFRHGHLEKVYERALLNRLSKKGLTVQQQIPITVYDEDKTIVGEYVADLFVEDYIIIEIKAVEGLSNHHVAQLFGYLRATRIEHGILVNFGAPKLQLKKFILNKI